MLSFNAVKTNTKDGHYMAAITCSCAKQTVFSWLSQVQSRCNVCFVELLCQISSKCSHRDSSLKQIYCLSWNAWQQMTGHKFGLSKTFFIRGSPQFLIFCKATNTCSMKHLHNYMKLLYFTDICAKELSHMPFSEV